MIRYIVLIGFVCSTGWGCTTPEEPRSLLYLEPIVLAQDGPALFQYWELDNEPALWAYKLGEVSALQAYKDSISQAIGTSKLAALIKRERTQANRVHQEGNQDDLSNYDLIHQGYLGEIRDINFIEAEILNYQIHRFPLLSHPTEFHGFIMEHADLGKLRIYFGASDQPWPPKATPLVSHLEDTLDEGWRLKYHLHNHYESDENDYVGIMSASLADAHYFKILKHRFDLPEALVTNGFTTLVLKAANFDQLNAHQQ